MVGWARGGIKSRDTGQHGEREGPWLFSGGRESWVRVLGSVKISECSQEPGEVSAQSSVSSHTHSLVTICCSQETKPAARQPGTSLGPPEGPLGMALLGGYSILTDVPRQEPLRGMFRP